MLDAGVNVKSAQKEGVGLLTGLVRDGDIDTFALLIDHGADVNLRDRIGGLPLYRRTG